MGNGKFGALPFFWHPSQASRLTIEDHVMLRWGWLSMRSSITCPTPDLRPMMLHPRPSPDDREVGPPDTNKQQMSWTHHGRIGRVSDHSIPVNSGMRMFTASLAMFALVISGHFAEFD
jgi:hypothetical protein